MIFINYIKTDVHSIVWPAGTAENGRKKTKMTESISDGAKISNLYKQVKVFLLVQSASNILNSQESRDLVEF